MKIINKPSIIYGNLFDHVNKHIHIGYNGTSVIVPHVCNNIGAFGAGFAGGVAKHYPIVKENYHLLGNHFLKNNLGYVQFVEVDKDNTYGHKLIFANMIAQNGTISTTNNRPLHYGALVKSMYRLISYINENYNDQKIQIHCPKFGCGLAGGNWKFIEQLIEDIWYDKTVFIYDLYKKSTKTFVN
jgi:hypothetical protein